MNCQQFTSLIVEAARGRMMDAAARDGAMRHAETCADCAARLAQEQSLTNALRTVATGMRDMSAPTHVEAKLLAAFRESRLNPQATNASPLNAATPALAGLSAKDDRAARASSPRRGIWRAAFVPTAIAASLALVGLVTLYKQFTRTAPTQGITPGIVAQQGGGELSPVAPAIASLSPRPASADSAGQANTGRQQQQPSQRNGAQRKRAGFARTPSPGIIASQHVIDGGRAIFAPGEDESAANHAGAAAKPVEAESVTEFIPLIADASAAPPLESGQLVRVQLPRSALASLGLPLNAERGNEPVKADVLLGYDGMARAIRFVR